MRMPYVMNWPAGLQWQFSGNWLLETVCQGQSGVGLINSWDTNAIRLDVSRDPAILNQIFRAAQNYKQVTRFGAVNLYSKYGHNSRHSGTLRVEKRCSAGLSFNAFYTLGKTLSETGAEGGGSGITYYIRRLEKARTNYDLRHRFVSVLSYELTFGKRRAWMNSGAVANHVFGGWELTWVQTLQSSCGPQKLRITENQ